MSSKFIISNFLIIFSYKKVCTGHMTGVEMKNGRMGVPQGVGLGVIPNWEVLGEPVFVIE